jgi:hypothetical protein
MNMPVATNLPWPEPHGDFVAWVDRSIGQLEVQLSELRGVLHGYLAGIAHNAEAPTGFAHEGNKPTALGED